MNSSGSVPEKVSNICSQYSPALIQKMRPTRKETAEMIPWKSKVYVSLCSYTMHLLHGEKYNEIIIAHQWQFPFSKAQVWGHTLEWLPPPGSQTCCQAQEWATCRKTAPPTKVKQASWQWPPWKQWRSGLVPEQTMKVRETEKERSFLCSCALLPIFML